jgi:hypothetical protein
MPDADDLVANGGSQSVFDALVPRMVEFELVQQSRLQLERLEILEELVHVASLVAHHVKFFEVLQVGEQVIGRQ